MKTQSSKACGVAFAVLFAAACSQEADVAEPAEDSVEASAEAEAAPTASEAPAATEPAAAAPAEIEGITNKRLSFAPGTSSARIEDSITGYETVDYLLNVREGQAMNISMGTSNPSAYFNLLEPGETDVAVFNGSMDENMFEGVAQESGDYRIRVYMMRSAARRDEKAPYVLEAIVN